MRCLAGAQPPGALRASDLRRRSWCYARDPGGGEMINQARAAAMLPAQDLERAKAFYRDKLGLTPTMESPGAIFYQLAGGTAFVAYPSSGQSSGTYTQLALEVQDFDGTVKALRSKGVKFEDYDTPMVKTVDGVAEAGPGMKIAWFKDSEG